MLNHSADSRARLVFVAIATLTGWAARSHGQGCEVWRLYSEAARAQGSGAAPDGVFVAEWLPRLLSAIGDEACAGDRKSLRADAVSMAMATQDWPAVAQICRGALDDPGAGEDDSPSGREDRCIWLWHAARASLGQAQDAHPDHTAEAVRAVDAFAAAVGALAPRTGGADGSRWLKPVAQALAMKAEVLCKAGDHPGAADAERQGSLFVASFSLDPEGLQRLGGLAPDEFLQRATTDMLRAGRVPQAVGLLASINLLAARARPAGAHARVALREAARLECTPEFARAALDVLPRDAEMVLFCKDAALLMWPRHDAEAAALIDRALASPSRVFADVAARRRASPEDPRRAAPPIEAELRVHRAVLAAKLGDFDATDRLIERVRADGSLGEWCRGSLDVIELERKRRR